MFQSIQPELTVRFVAFVNEEPPFFMTDQQGSAVYTKDIRRQGDDVRLMISLETIGCYNDAPGSQSYPPLFRFFFAERGNSSEWSLISVPERCCGDSAKAFRMRSNFPVETVSTFRFIPGVSWSDHHSFWRNGYRALMVTDTAFYRYLHYHAASDTPDKLAYPEFAQVTLGLFEAVAALSREGFD